MFHVRIWLALLGILVGVALAITLSGEPAAAAPPPAALAAALADHGVTLEPMPGSAATVGPSTAVAVAAAEMGGRSPDAMYLGSLTADSIYVDGKAPHDLPVYAAQFTGLELYPNIPYGQSPGTGVVHHEQVVFVDAVSGEYLFAVTVR